MKEIKCTCGKGNRPGVHRFEGQECDKVPSLFSRIKRKILTKTLRIGVKRERPGSWSIGIEFSLWSPARRGIVPRFEVFCFKLVQFPPRGEMFKKGRDVRGLWKIVWWQPDMILHQKKIFQRKGFRTRHITVPVKITGLFRTW